jgi:branched-chain amino acid transport system ATP-binding protein
VNDLPGRGLRRRARSDPWILDVRNVTVQFGSVRAVDGVNIRVPYRGFVGIMGPNGAGKTTLFNAITGFVQPTGGVVRFRGRRIGHWPAHRRARAGIGRTFQNVGLNKRATVLENLWVAVQAGPLGHELSSFSVGTFDELTRRRPDVVPVLERLHIHELLGSVVADLPHGTAKQVELACVLARRPTLLLLDEPTSGLGPDETGELATVLLDLHASQPVSILVIEHDMPFVTRCAEHIHVLDFGRLLASGTPEEVTRNPAVLEAYLGTTAGVPT